MLFLLIALGVVVVFGFMSYNGLVGLRQKTHQAFADIDVQLKQRHDLIPNLVEVVKGYARHERETLDAVIAARNSAVAASGPQAQVAAEGQLSGALRQLFALSENYPDLKANTNYVRLQDQLQHVEDKLAAARRFFNLTVTEYNTARERVPAAFFAPALGFAAASPFDLDDGERLRLDEAPQIKLS